MSGRMPIRPTDMAMVVIRSTLLTDAAIENGRELAFMLAGEKPCIVAQAIVERDRLAHLPPHY